MKSKRLQVSDKIKNHIMVGSKSHFSEKVDKIKNNYSARSSLKDAGRADIYYRFGLTFEWDTAAMQSGGIFKQMDGTDAL